MTLSMSILNESLQFDIGVYPSKLSSELTLTNVKDQMCIVMPAPTGADLGLSGSFEIPENYASAPVIRATFVIDGTPANTLGVLAQQIAVDEAATIDVAYEAEDTASNATWTGYADEEIIKISITITPTATYTPGKRVFWTFKRDDSVDNTSFAVLLTDLRFQYTES